MFYPKLVFPTKKDRPFFYTNFVQTLDGKVAVKRRGYWPIGSKIDHDVLVELRAYADCLIHGKNLYNEFGNITRHSLQEDKFKALRKKLGKTANLPYIVGSHNLKKLILDLYHRGFKNVLVEGGPTLLGSFLKENLIDEIFLTIVPKIYGTQNLTTLNLVEGILFPPDSTKKLKLLSVKQIGNELFLRYSVMN